MVQLEILSGKQAGTSWVTRRFPVRVGRAADNDLSLEGNGVWDRHAELHFCRSKGIEIRPHPQALVHVNGEQVNTITLRSGDVLELGSAKLRFWLSPPRQRGFRTREWLTWVGIALVCLAQIALIYLLR